MTKYFYILLVMCTTAFGLKVAPSPTASSLIAAHESRREELGDYEDSEAARMDDEYDEMYASEFPYGQAMGKYKKEERPSSRKARAHHVRIIHRTAKPRNYAKKYRTWAPSKEYLKYKHRPVAPKKMRPPPKRPGHRGDGIAPNNRRRKMPPARGNQLRRPKPPPEVDYEYFEEDYFPEESKRNEYTAVGGKKSKPRRPPGSGGRITHQDQRGQDDYPSVSYMNFVHSPNEDYNDVQEDDHVRQQDRRRKKKRKKGEKTRGHIRGSDQYGANSESIEEHQRYEKYPPYAEDDPPLRRPVRRPTRAPAPAIQTTPVYGDGYLGHQTNRPHNVNIGTTSQYQHDPNYVGVQTFQNQQEQYEPQNFHPQYSSNLKTYTPTPQIQYNPYANQNYQNNENEAFAPAVPFRNQQQPHGFQRQPKPNYESPVQPVQQHSGYTTRANEYSAKYKSSSFFDNTDTFQDFNQNADFQQNTGGNRNKFVPSAEYSDHESSSDTDFINRHLDLYSNGMTGVPVQGLQSGSRNKDYDIGYGEIHYDETHRT